MSEISYIPRRSCSNQKLTLINEKMSKCHLMEFHNQPIDLPVKIPAEIPRCPRYQKYISKIQREGEKSNLHVSPAKFWDGVTENKLKRWTQRCGQNPHIKPCAAMLHSNTVKLLDPRRLCPMSIPSPPCSHTILRPMRGT